MQKQKRLTTLLMMGCTVMGVGQADQDQQTTIDPLAIQALDTMGDYLRNLSTFKVTANQTVDEILDSGMKIQRSSTIDLQVHRPGKLHADIESERRSLQMFFNGKEFTLVGKTGLYATVLAPTTIGELVTRLETKYGIEFPLVDLFYWGRDADAVADIKTAMLIGSSKLNGQMTNHYAFRQDDLDWQIWITQGKTSLPLRYVITSLDEPSQPQFIANLNWDTTSALDNATFTFKPSKDQYPITIVAIDEMPQ